MKIEITEFLLRPPASWHVELRSTQDDGFGGTVVSEPRMLNMEQAEEQGWPLPEILKELNVQAVAELEREKALRQELEEQITELTVRAERAERALAERETMAIAAAEHSRANTFGIN
jgi:hypothetical protein